MTIHINKFSHFQAWEQKKIFEDYPLHIKSGKYTVTLLFNDRDSIEKMCSLLHSMLYEIDEIEKPYLIKDEDEDIEVPF